MSSFLKFTRGFKDKKIEDTRQSADHFLWYKAFYVLAMLQLTRSVLSYFRAQRSLYPNETKS